MATSVKQKIRWGTFFLFVLLLLLEAVSIFHIMRLQRDSNIILNNNYESVEYGHRMLAALDSFNRNPVLYGREFDNALRQQERNVTERGEAGHTRAIRELFNRIRSTQLDEGSRVAINAEIQAMLLLNMTAIQAKNTKAGNTAEKAVTYITAIAAIIFLIALTFTVNFPSVITGPVAAITQGIRQIAEKNYAYRIHLNSGDEFSQMAGSFNTMAERLEFFENSNLNKLIFEKARAEAVINSLKDASIGIDKNNLVLFANNHALLLLGMNSADIVGKTTQAVSDRNDLFRFLLEEKSSMPFKIVVDNRENYYIKEQTEIGEPGADGRVIVLKNITSFKELDVAKTNFIATVSHELKTPLASSDFSLKLLQDDRVSVLTGEQKELVENLKRDNERMLRILSELLNIAQVESGKMQINLQQVSAGKIVDGALETVANAARQKDIQLVRPAVNAAVVLNADADKTAWVLNNLLTNAVKYAPGGSSVVTSVEEKDGELIFSVADEGPGIAEEYRSRVFERFFRIPGSSSGTGLGLAISKEFIEAQGGRIWVESVYGQGSTFKFSFPVGS